MLKHLSAKKNANINRIDNINFLAGDAEDLIPQMIQQSTHEEIIAVIGEFLLEQWQNEAANTFNLMYRSSESRYCYEGQDRYVPRGLRKLFVSSDPKATIKNFVDLSRPSSATIFGDPFMPVSPY